MAQQLVIGFGSSPIQSNNLISFLLHYSLTKKVKFILSLFNLILFAAARLFFIEKIAEGKQAGMNKVIAL